MHSIKVNKDKLLDIVRKNRDEHEQIWKEACESFKKEYVQDLEERLADAKEGRSFDSSDLLDEPVNHLAEYDQAITMLDLSCENEIELSYRECSQYLMDQWAWQEEFLYTNSGWSRTAREKAAVYTMGSVDPKSYA